MVDIKRHKMNQALSCPLFFREGNDRNTPNAAARSVLT